MRIDERNLSEQASSTAGRAAESQRIQVDTSPSSGISGGSAADHVDLSGLAGRISQTMQAMAQTSAQRVSQLRQQFQSGRYQPDPGKLSQALAGALTR